MHLLPVFHFGIGLSLAKAVLAYSAKGAFEIVGKILKLRSGSYSKLGIAKLLVVFPSASIANVFFHIVFSFRKVFISLLTE